jgi:uncharacterized membrane protein
MVDLGTLGDRRSAPRSVNERGQVVGGNLTEAGEMHAIMWDPTG